MPVDFGWAQELAAFLEVQRKGAPAPDSIESQIQGVFQAGYCRDLGLIRYAQDGDVDEVRKLLRRSTEYTIAVYQFRDMEPHASDVSLTNSRRGLHALELALSGGAIDLAKRLAPMVWDPPDASYLGPGSVVCTAEDQHLAYALRDLLMDRLDDGRKELDAPMHLEAQQEHRASMLRALLNHDRAESERALTASHAFHLDVVDGRNSLNNLDDLLDVPTLAYAALGRARISDLKLPPPDAYLPLELGRLSQ